MTADEVLFFCRTFLFPLEMSLFHGEFHFSVGHFCVLLEFLLTEANLTQTSIDTGSNLPPFSSEARVKLPSVSRNSKRKETISNGKQKLDQPSRENLYDELTLCMMSSPSV